MPRKERFVALVDRLHHEHPELQSPELSISGGDVRVDGVVVTNPKGLVRRQGAITITAARPLRGAVKLRAVLDAFAVTIDGATAVDLGASTGGFTSVLLERGARRVYAVDAGYGQLLGRLRQDPRVVNRERTNLGRFSPNDIPEVLDVATMDLSYVPLADALPQLGALTFAADARLIALVKPMYELGLAEPPTNPEQLTAAVDRAIVAISAAGWSVIGSMRSPITGSRGAIEFFVYARRSVIERTWSEPQEAWGIPIAWPAMSASPMVRGLRGATTVDEDSVEQVTKRSQELMRTIMERNELAEEDIVSVLFTATADVTSIFPPRPFAK